MTRRLVETARDDLPSGNMLDDLLVRARPR
jgi:hypothetical protein